MPILESTGITALLFQIVTPANINNVMIVMTNAIKVIPILKNLFILLLQLYQILNMVKIKNSELKFKKVPYFRFLF